MKPENNFDAFFRDRFSLPKPSLGKLDDIRNKLRKENGADVPVHGKTKTIWLPVLATAAAIIVCACLFFNHATGKEKNGIAARPAPPEPTTPIWDCRFIGLKDNSFIAIVEQSGNGQIRIHHLCQGQEFRNLKLAHVSPQRLIFVDASKVLYYLDRT